MTKKIKILILCPLFFIFSPNYNSGTKYIITKKTSSVRKIVSREWKQIAGPKISTIETPFSDTTKVSALDIPGDYYFEYTVTSSSGLSASDTVMVRVNPAVALPVDFCRLSALSNENYNKVTFVVENEIDVIKYEVQSSTDGINYEKIKEIYPANVTEYSYNDFKISFVCFYRIRVISFGGKEQYSNVVKLVNKYFAEGMKVVSPSSGRLEIYFSSKKNSSVEISMINVVGQKVFISGENCFVGINNYIYNVKSKPAGVYVVVLKSDSKIYRKKFLLIK